MARDTRPQNFPKAPPLPGAVGLKQSQMPWTNGTASEQAFRAGIAGVLLHKVLLRSKSSGMKP